MSQPEGRELTSSAKPQPQTAAQVQIRKVAISPDGKLALVVTRDSIYRLDLAGLSEGSSEVLSLTGPRAHAMKFTGADGGQQKPASAVFGADSSEIVTVGTYEATLWDVSGESPKELERFLPSLLAQSARFSSDQTMLVTTHTGDNARIWDIRTGRVKCRLTDQDAAKNTRNAPCAVFAPDRGWVYTGDDDGVVNVWDATDGSWVAELCRNERAESSINDLAVSPGGQYLVTACKDNAARVWDLTVDVSGAPIQQAKPRLTLQGHMACVRCVDVSADGRWIITGSDDETAKIWDAETDADTAKPASEYRATGAQAEIWWPNPYGVA